MRAVIQRVSSASVSVGGRRVSAIGAGLAVLLGISGGDGDSDIAYLADKLVNLRVFTDGAGKLNLSVADSGGEILVVSQFTLYGDARKGRRPDYGRAAPGDAARAIYERALDALRRAYPPERIKTGAFGEHMSLEIANDGPVTILLDSEKAF
jgi:D-tyrosyl-tRNA(Tyr) deacylase